MAELNEPGDSVRIVPHGRRRWRRWLLYGASAALAGSLLVAWVVTRPAFLRARIVSAVADMVGGEVTVGDAAHEGSGVIVARNIVIRSVDVPGEGGEVLRVGRGEVRLNLADLLCGNVRIDAIALDDVRVRLSESREQPGRFNFMTLGREWSDDDEAMLPPPIRVGEVEVQVGVHDEHGFELRGRRRLTGTMAATPGRREWFDIALREVGVDPAGRELIVIDGQWNAQTFEHRATIEGVVLDERAFDMCPETVRRWCRELDLRGSIPAARFHWSPEAPLSAELHMEQVALTLPIHAAQLWARFRDGRMEPSSGLPRMRVEHGVMRVEGEAFTLENLQGFFDSSEMNDALVPVPYRVTMRVPALRGGDRADARPWMEQLVEAGAFELVMHVDNFALKRAGDGELAAVDLPRQVARVMEKFRISTGSMSAEVHIERGFADVNDSGGMTPQPIKARGTASIRGAAGSYYKFPLPMENVDADLEFDDESVRVIRLTSAGAGGEQIRISGYVAPPQQHAAVQLTIQAIGLPLDERLRMALPEDSRRAFDSLFDRARYEDLKSAGLIRGDDAIADAAQQHEQLSARLAAIRADAATDDPEASADAPGIEAELARLDRVIDAGPFELGGMVNLDLAVDRPQGPNQRTVITGAIDIQRAGVIHERFGYPFHVLGGRLDWQRDRIAIVASEHSDGLRVATLNGGVGTVAGAVLTPRIDGQKRVQPELRLDIQDDRVSELIFAAIPGAPAAISGSDADPPPLPLTVGGYFMRSLGLEARVDWAGDVSTADSGNASYDFIVNLSGATLKPLQSLSRAVGSESLVWPEGFVLSDGAGRVRATSQGVELLEYAARRGECLVEAHGALDMQASPMRTALDLRFTNLECGTYLLPLVPPASAARVADQWSRHQPSGTIDAHLIHEGEIGGAQQVRVSVEPRSLSLLLDGRAVLVRGTAGHLSLGAQRVAMEHLCVDLFSGDRRDGSLELDGEFVAGGVADRLDVRGAWRSGRFESPLITEIMKRSGAEHLVPRFLEFDPQGEFSATFHVDSGALSADDRYAVTMHPETLALSVAGQRIESQLSENAIVSLAPGAIRLLDVHGSHPGGEIAIGGVVNTATGVDADLTIAYRATSISPQLLACLPRVVRDSLQAIHFQTSSSIEMEPSRWRARRVATAGEPSHWESTFDGVIRTQAASFTAALSFDQLDGAFEIHARQAREGGALDIQAQAARVCIGGRHMTDAGASIHLDHQRSRLEIPDFRAECYEGVVTASAVVGLQDNLDYETRVGMVGVSLEPFSKPVALSQPDAGAAADVEHPAARGQLFGTFDLAGRLGEPGSRIGRSTIRVIEARMADMPLTLGVLQLMELMPPLAGSLDFANVQLYIEGDQAIFDQVVVESPTLELTGEGAMNIDSLELDMKFRSRGTMAVWSDLVTLFSDQLFIIEVTGPLAQPKARLVALPGMRKPQDARSKSADHRLVEHPE